jgi:hypothetical protein
MSSLRCAVRPLLVCALCLVALAPSPAGAARVKKAKKQQEPPAPPAPALNARLRLRANVAAACTATTAADTVKVDLPEGQETTLEVPPGSVRIVCKSAGFDDAIANLEVAPDQGLPLRLILPRLEPETGSGPLDLTARGAPALGNDAPVMPGCRAKVYLPKGTDVRGPLPAAPAETLLLGQLPQISSVARDPENGGQPNTLLRGLRSAITNVSLYAVVFEGYFLAQATGAHTVVATSDDPVSITLDGVPVLRSDFSADASVGQQIQRGQVATAQVQVALAKGRWYRVEITARQRWAPFPWGEDLPQEALDAAATNRGATLRVLLGAPGEPPSALHLVLPASPTASR